jgi:hypothetical protein
MSAFSVGKSLFQFESGLSYLNETHSNLFYKTSGYSTDFTIRWGVLKEELEFVIDINYQSDSGKQLNFDYQRAGMRQTLLGLKYLVYDPFKNKKEKPNLYSWKANQRFKWKQLIPAVAVFAGVNLNFSDGTKFYNTLDLEPIASPKAMVVAQNHFGTRWVLVSNLAYNKIATPFASIDYVITLTRGFNDKWSGFVENQGYSGKYYSDGVFRGGAAYLLNKNMQLDASVGYNIKSSPRIFNAGVGFSWRFIDNYKEVKIKAPDQQSKMDKKMEKAAEKDKKNKRKDQKIE